MELLFTEQFEEAYARLTADEKRSVRKSLSLLTENLEYPSLRLKKMEGGRDIWEARPSRKLRLTFKMTGDTITLRNVGGHDRVLKNP